MKPFGAIPPGPLLWRGPGDFVPATRPAGPGPPVADSWLVDEGRCRGIEEHRARFVRSMSMMDAHPPSVRPLTSGWVNRFMDDVLAVLPRSGRWFPRVDRTGDELTLWIRPAPDLSSEVVLWGPGVPDPRIRPGVKGPDLPRLADLRRQAALVGAGEALLVSPAGTVLEGALSTVLWWRGDVLYSPPRSDAVLPGVTWGLLDGIAGAWGVETRHENVPPTALEGLETWSVSALHGIRAVTGWRGLDMKAGAACQAPAWQAALLALARPLP
ncbi:aminotransferase class IV [Kineosporia sp. NBRC 101731]|uniref:aminotransferase class IV n=1 Tax=Kineosporia sp. NBRC 101731 TaxID=3032199 RepID=UPI0024A4AC8D|nr:aminotransferase class IV [Kineosporia sp. NBRC 101731]GLY33589.1 hypothetical protein Kisp02_69540 [Kineosporia sp. NBRC 101731]